MLTHPRFLARRSIVAVQDELHGEILMQNVFPRLTKTPGSVHWSGAELGAHNHEVLHDLLEMNAEQIASAQGPK